MAGTAQRSARSGRGQGGIARTARQVLQVDRELRIDDVQAPGSAGARRFLQARQREVVFHYPGVPRHLRRILTDFYGITT